MWLPPYEEIRKLLRKSLAGWRGKELNLRRVIDRSLEQEETDKGKKSFFEVLRFFIKRWKSRRRDPKGKCDHPYPRWKFIVLKKKRGERGQWNQHCPEKKNRFGLLS